MEFPFYLTEALKLDKEGIAVLQGKTYYVRGGTTSASFYNQQANSQVPKEFQKVAAVLDKMGEASSKVCVESTSWLIKV